MRNPESVSTNSRGGDSESTSMACALCPVHDSVVYRQLLRERPHAAEELRTSVRVLDKGQNILRQGEPRKFSYTLRSGWAYRYMSTRDGRRQILALLTPGDFIGQGGYGQERWTFSVQALTRVTLCEFPIETILKELMTMPNAMSDVLRVYGQSQRRSDDLALGLGARNALERIAYFVCLLTRRLGPKDEDALNEPFNMELPLRRDDMADALGITSVHTSRGLGKLKQMGVLQFNRGSFRILNLARLREIAGI